MSLLESCASLAIISAVVVFAAPSLIRARENYQLEVVARQAAGHMHWTRIKAISRNRNCRFRVVSDTSYVIECQDAVWRTDETAGLPRGFHISANAAPEFHRRGTQRHQRTASCRTCYSRYGSRACTAAVPALDEHPHLVANKCARTLFQPGRPP